MLKMDCNSMEEAKKAMELAEIKFKANDVEGAKRIAKNACGMFGDLPGIRHAVAAYEFHLAAAKNNWHAVLGLLPGDDDDLRKAREQFLKMSTLTHPDKNPSAAADGAFKFVMEAWNRLFEATLQGKSTSSNGNAKDDNNNNNAESGRKKQQEEAQAKNWFRPIEEYDFVDREQIVKAYGIVIEKCR